MTYRQQKQGDEGFTMRGGGLEEVMIMKTDEDRGTIKLGKKRLFDIVTSGDEKLVVYKEKRGEVITVKANDLIGALKRLIG